jgi:metal-responsive CopG/Arc/MetJ family transcriptional regulator
MKVQTSVMLPESLLSTIGQLSEQGKTLSDFIETALQLYIAKLKHSDNSYKDIEIINRNADDLNQETQNALEYQV